MVGSISNTSGPWKFGHLVKKKQLNEKAAENQNSQASQQAKSPLQELPQEVIENPDLLAEAIGRKIPPGIHKKLVAQLEELAAKESSVEEAEPVSEVVDETVELVPETTEGVVEEAAPPTAVEEVAEPVTEVIPEFSVETTKIEVVEEAVEASLVEELLESEPSTSEVVEQLVEDAAVVEEEV